MLTATQATQANRSLTARHAINTGDPASVQHISGRPIGRKCSASSQTARSAPCRSSSSVRCSAASATASSQPSASVDPKAAISVLMEAAARRNIPTERLVEAFKVLEKAKLPADTYPKTIGDVSGWQLIWTSGEKQWQERLGRDLGFYSPVTTVMKYDIESNYNQQGVYFGPLGAFVTSGACSMAKNNKTLSTTADKLRLRLGPKWFSFDIRKKSDKPEDAEAGGKADLQGGFTFVAANDKIIAGRGLGGGMALWASTKPSWQLSKGIDL